jgi:competence protein ComEC
VRSRGVPVRSVVAGDHWETRGARFSIWHPPGSDEESSSLTTDNARSVVLDVEAVGHHVLLTGDLEGAGLFELRRRPLPRPDVFLAPHHGGRTANPPWLYDWADPRLVVVSQRPPAPGSHDALAPLAARQMLLRTWQRGAIHLEWTEGGVVARGFRDDQAGWNE